jgi:hypothetical protein
LAGLGSDAAVGPGVGRIFLAQAVLEYALAPFLIVLAPRHLTMTV